MVDRAGDGTVVAARGLTKRYDRGVIALDGLNLTIGRGEFVGFLGPSGAGKTTLFRLLNGALRPTTGELAVFGTALPGLHGAALRHLRCRIATVPQSHGLVSSLTAAQNVILGTLGGRAALPALRMLAYLTPGERAAAFDALNRVGIGDKIYTRVDQLSGGQQQRVAVARALLQGANLILADEPIASVDAETAVVLLGLFRELCATGRTVLVSLHQPDLARGYCPRIVSLAAGRVVYDGPAEGAAAVAAQPTPLSNFPVDAVVVGGDMSDLVQAQRRGRGL